jgi:hypothetical protein
MGCRGTFGRYSLVDNRGNETAFMSFHKRAITKGEILALYSLVS